MKRALLSLVTLTLCAGVIAAQEKPGFSGRAAVDKIFAPWDTRESPGCALGILFDKISNLSPT